MNSSSTSSSSRYTWQYIIGIALRHRRELVSAHIFAVCAMLTTIPIPLLMPLMVDEVLLAQPGSATAFIGRWFPYAWHGPVLYIVVVLVATICLRLAALGFGVWQLKEFSTIAKDITYRIRRELLLRLSRTSISEYETMGSGAVGSLLVVDLEVVDKFIGTTVEKFIISVLMLIGIGAVLLWMHWPLALFILCINPLVIYFTVLLGKQVKGLKQHENATFEHFQVALAETLDGILEIRAANRERDYFRRVIRRAREVRDGATAFAWKSDTANRLSFLVFVIGFDVFRAIIMLLVVFSDLTIGEMMAVFGYLWFMMDPVQKVLNIQYAYFEARAALGRINRLLDLELEPRYPHRLNPFACRQQPTVSIRVEDLCFSYGDGPLVLDHLSLSIAQGEKVALVGASGGGKSTLVQVLLGLYPPKSGAVLFNGIPVTEIGLDVARQHVAVVLQHPVLFNDTVRNNLSLGKTQPDATLWRALEIAQLKADVEAMNDGLDNLVGHQGVRLSGGQRQRLAVARMILADPKVVIMDEATSALDTETESRLHQAMGAFLRKRTTLIVAHRLSAVKQADRVYVFDAGRIVEEGRHTELLQVDGIYSKLYGKRQRP
uniref:ATP-binding cassette, subfamily C n=1 Tax=Candidatus Kentrum sp. LPFa TaxID=2126335 RepID=A0A450XE51_9GAMM|nr:MAG: ATP-binding cassette, subfamily C [Candidatus Kentron sp. LPFa]VFK27548.1 MAG: ATP-binding cassette, subfamily C [Candidatus Kentron sp. LPFa]